jgi:hypothetical protein
MLWDVLRRLFGHAAPSRLFPTISGFIFAGELLQATPKYDIINVMYMAGRVGIHVCGAHVRRNCTQSRCSAKRESRPKRVGTSKGLIKLNEVDLRGLNAVMRKHHQKQILELLHTLCEAHTEIRRLLSAGQTDAAIGLLSDCQEVAARIGDFVDRLAGEGTRTVAHLEEYCELLYRAAAEISGPGVGDGRHNSAIVKPLQKQLIKTESGVRTDLKPDRMEVIFLPYKTSMWDSFDTIWLAAKNNPACDAYVIPIPYYDKLPNGALGKMHCEAGDYPEYVAVTDWREYNIEERRPDVIVIHNPYDDGNLVTSVHPDFYSERLKKLTDLLVYVPYFVCVDDVPEHFCTCAGVLNADRVIVQSEKVRNTYIRMFKTFERAHNCKGRFGRAEAKFAALGSPKFDKVLSAARESQEIPDEWREMIENPDGTRKKVVLYNTSIGALLADNEKALNKLRCVFDCFRNRDDLVLLWRPHPLNEATYRAMRPGLARAYAEIVAEYKREGFGIHDDTADMRRAIAVSDAYYGDWSSLVALYGITGKPVMIQNADVTEEDDARRNLAFENLYDNGEYFWFTAYAFNGLFRMDKETWKAEYMGSFPGEKADGHRLYRAIAGLNGRLYFAPFSAEEIACYDTHTGCFEKITVPAPDTDREYLPDRKFAAAVAHEDCVFFVGCGYPGILRINAGNGNTECFSDWAAELQEMKADSNTAYFRTARTVGKNIAAASLKSNTVLLFDPDSCVSDVRAVGAAGNRYVDLCFDGADYWLLPKSDGPAVRWNSETGLCEECADFPQGIDGGEWAFWSVEYAAGRVWLFPFAAGAALKLCTRDGSVRVADEFRSEHEKTSELINGACILSAVTGGKLYAHTGKTNRFIEYDPGTGRRREEAIAVPPEAEDIIREAGALAFEKDAAACKGVYDCYFYESQLVTLRGFADRMTRHGDSENAKALRDKQIEIHAGATEAADGSAGAEIFTHCKRIVLGRAGAEAGA